MRLEVEKGWQKASIWKTGIRISKLIKEWVNKCLNLEKSFKKILANQKVNKENLGNGTFGLVLCLFPLCKYVMTFTYSSASQIGGVLEQPGYQINSFRWHSFVKYLEDGMSS